MARKYQIWAILLLMVWAMGFTVAAQSAATKNETIKLIINGVEFNTDRALFQAVDEPLDSVIKKFHSLEVCQNQSEDNVREQNPAKYKNWDSIGKYLRKNDFNGAREAFGDLQLIEALYHYELKDTIDGIGCIWYDNQTANKIPAMVRSSNRLGHVCTDKIKALSWIIWIYRNDTPINNYLVFKNAKDEVIYDYFCYKQIDKGVDEYGRINIPDVSFVKQPTDGYDELVNEIGAWIDLVKEVGIDEVRKKGIAPLSSIKYEIISYEEIMPELFEPAGYELKTIRGLVIDDLDFEPVPLVDIMIDDSVKIASTQLNGFFSILGPDTIKSLCFRAVGFEPMKVELCDDDYLEVIMISTSSDCFLTKDEAKKKTQKRFKQLGKLRKEALKRGIFQTKKPCYKQIFVQ